MLSVTEAAEAAGVSRTTIYDRLKSGELSKTSNGIDPAELLRVFGELKAGPGTDRPSVELSTASPELVTWLRELVDQQQATIARKDEQLREAEERAAEERRGLLAQLDRTMALLQPPAPTEPMSEPPRGFWKRVLG